jgi:hypothetical protein
MIQLEEDKCKSIIIIYTACKVTRQEKKRILGQTYRDDDEEETSITRERTSYLCALVAVGSTLLEQLHQTPTKRK